MVMEVDEDDQEDFVKVLRNIHFFISFFFFMVSHFFLYRILESRVSSNRGKHQHQVNHAAREARAGDDAHYGDRG